MNAAGNLPSSGRADVTASPPEFFIRSCPPFSLLEARMAAGPLHATLVANTVTPLTLDVADPPPENLSTTTPPKARVEVLSVTGTAEVYFTTDGTTPTVGGATCYVLPAVICALTVDDGTAGPTSVVKLISTGTPKVSVRAA